MTPRPLTFTYTNWRGETADRRVIPETFRFAATEWHPEPQWLLVAFDLDKGQRRDFAVKDIVLPLVEGEADQGVEIKALEWEHLGGAFWRATMPLFGTLRVENYGNGHLVSWSVPGFTSQFIDGRWGSADEAKAAAQAEYDRRIRSALHAPRSVKQDEAAA